MFQQGYVKFFRQIADWEWYTDVNVFKLFTHCLIKANYQDKEWRGITIKKGSFVTSYENLSKETGLSPQQVRTAINKLKSTGELTYQSTSQYSIITVNNWDEFQEDNKQINNQITSEQQTNNNQITTTKESKEIEEIEERKKNKENEEKKGFDFFDEKISKSFEIYKKECPNLIPLSFERKNRSTIQILSEVLDAFDYDVGKFKELCVKANDLIKIANTKIDFKMMLNCYIGILQGKYKEEETSMFEGLDFNGGVT